MKEILAV